jgi:ABC-type branched-subunit amino acid transport system substrate-binding protein
MIRRSAVGSTGVAGKVGVLLPRTGEYAAIGKRIEQVVRLANERAGTRMQLVFLDAHGDPAATKQAVEDLVVKEQVVAILGPLLKEDVMEAARAAQSLGVPMVALSQAQDPASVGDYVFRGVLPLEQQVKALVDHAMGVEGMRSFATLHPRSSFGDHAADLFRAEVERRGGKVIREADYDEDATSFFEQARIIGAKDYKARAGEFAAVKRAAAAKGADPSKAVLPPQIDFDAIFIPDSWQRAALVASSLAYEEFPVGSFRPNRHAARVPLLGLNAWNDPRIVDVGGAYVQQAIFVDAFAPQSDLPGVQQFVQDHDSSLGRKPGVIDALAWDATRLLGAAVTAGGDDRGAVRDELLQARISGPLTGGDRFGSDREVDRKLVVLTIRGGGIRIWHPPELSPEGPEGAP